ncbi:MAG: ATP-binding domain-containing protein, partial [Bacteroidales bacterium]|nr:ATP-binding domain-containing protein [Bacteroidales bacterium]
DRSGYLAALRADTSPEGIARFENAEELFSSIKEYLEEESEMRQILSEDGEAPVATLVTLSDYLENIYLLSEAEKDDTQDPDKDQTNKITLMTVHAAKGLEFPYVYVAGMEENLFPSESMNDTPDKIEEERRLFYVALTRAQKVVTVSYAQNRRKWGSEESNRPSRFLREIDRQYYAVEPDTDQNRYDPFPQTRFRRSDFETYRQPGRQQSWQRPAQPQQRPAAAPPRPVPASPAPAHTPSPGFAPSPVAALQVGQRVEHDRFGYGTILSLEGDGPNRKAVVSFDASGQKTLLLKFAKLRIV